MNEDLKHRGIRSTTRSYFNSVSLGHVRLPIQGLSPRWDHPMTYKNWDGAMVGEAFNFLEIDPIAETDLAVILEHWAKNGVSCFHSFDGFWAAVFIDQLKKVVHVVTDPLAKKPLYFRTTPQAISSEIWPLVNLGKTTENLVYYSMVAKWGYPLDGSTPFNEIRKIGPGVHLRLSKSGQILSTNTYGPWVMRRQSIPNLKVLRRLIELSVHRRLISDVPVSLLLSGGLDSTILFKLIEQQTHNFTVFHVENNESEFLDDLNIPSDIPVIRVPLSNPDLMQALTANQSPVDLGSVLPQYALGQAIRQHGFHVAISGDGADEIFGGYRRAKEYDSQLSDIFQELIYYHLPRLDFLMMASTVELRCPYLATNIIETMAGTPWAIRRSKEILKIVFRDLVPQRIRAREKTPLKIPAVQADKMKWRLNCIKVFREEVLKYERG